MAKVKKTLYVAVLVSLASQIQFNFLADGFIVAMSVVAMSIFLYCYEELSPITIGICSGIFSPLFRMIVLVLGEHSLRHAVTWAVPDILFFFSYGIFYTLIYRYIIKEPKSIRNFPYVILFCDFLSNCMEMTGRSLIQGTCLFHQEVLFSLGVIACLRTALIQVILLAMETYSNLLVKNEHDEEYRRLLSQASVFESELHVMEKNVVEIEDIMKQAFQLYKSMESMGVPEELRKQSLDISKNAHEVKGDYLGILGALRGTYLDGLREGKMSIRDIILIERSNMQKLIKSKGLNIEIQTRLRTDFYIEQNFKMMSVIRNLLLNAIEAIGERGGRILISLQEEEACYTLRVRDNGPGIPKENLETIFFEFFSTKFDTETGNVQRGIGLSVVKDYIENYFGGNIEVKSEPGKFTEFVISMEKQKFEEAECHEILSD